MNSIQVFNYQDFNVRTFTDENGEVWLVAKDVCEVLGIQNHRDACTILDNDERDEVGITDAIGRKQSTTVINEPGLYKLTFRSRKPQAKKFTRWVTHEVLPEIRRTGSYTAPHAKGTVVQSYAQEQKLPAHSGSIKAAERILHKVFRCKKDEDFMEVIALDEAFYRSFGHSLLEAQGIRLGKKTITVQVLVHLSNGPRYFPEEKEVFYWEHGYDLDKLAERNNYSC